MEVDFTEMAPDDVESGGSVRPGWYRCLVTEVKDSQFAAGNKDVQFTVTHGPYKGSRIFDTIVEPNNAADTDKAKKCRNRIAMYLTRLHLFTKEQLAGKNLTIDWTELVGREAVVEVKEDSYTKEGSAVATSRVKITFDGVHGIDGEKIPDDVKKKLGIANKPKPKDDDGNEGQGQTAKAPPKSPAPAAPKAKPKVDVSKL